MIQLKCEPYRYQIQLKCEPYRYQIQLTHELLSILFKTKIPRGDNFPQALVEKISPDKE